MADEVRVTRLQDGVYLASRPLDEGLEVRAALLLGERRAAMIDTMTCPEDMAPFLALISMHGRPAIVVNTHADWDHAWGNAAYPGAPIVGHRACRERLLGPDERATLEQKRAQSAAQYANVALVPPDMTFETAMALDLGGLTLELHHLPGHTKDCLVAYVPERRLLYAGDCAEDPFPLLHSGPLDEWVQDLRGWAARAVDTVVPSHGRIGGVELLRHNAEYLQGLPSGATPPTGIPAFYVGAHAENLETARRLAAT